MALASPPAAAATTRRAAVQKEVENGSQNEVVRGVLKIGQSLVYPAFGLWLYIVALAWRGLRLEVGGESWILWIRAEGFRSWLMRSACCGYRSDTLAYQLLP